MYIILHNEEMLREALRSDRDIEFCSGEDIQPGDYTHDRTSHPSGGWIIALGFRTEEDRAQKLAGQDLSLWFRDCRLRVKLQARRKSLIYKDL